MKPSECFSPDLAWWLRDSAAAFGESSTLAASLDRMFLYRKNPRQREWRPERQPRDVADRDRDMSRLVAGEERTIDPRDYFVDGCAIDGPRRIRARDRKPAPARPEFTAIPNKLTAPEPATPTPDLSPVRRARRVARAWFKLPPEQRQRLWLAYLAGIDWGTEAEHRVYRLAAFDGALDVVMEVARAA